jgi:oligopeptide transport system ATP-binding protein
MIEVKNVSKLYSLNKNHHFLALNQVNLAIRKGEILGLVGQSGCGKSTLGKILLGLIKPTSGTVYFEGNKVDKLLPKQMQMVFQDPYSSLNPRMTIGKILKEPTDIHRLKNRTDELLDLVNLPKESKNRYPHEFSGGQRQRIAIARALALNPKFLICDEPISALDVSIQAQIINLLKTLQKELNLSILFIAHDLSVVRYISDRIAVMKKGEILEIKESEELFLHPSHCYTQQLVSLSTDFLQTVLFP